MSRNTALINRVTNTLAKRLEKVATPGKRWIIQFDDEEPLIIKTKGGSNVQHFENDRPQEDDSNE